MGLYFKQHVILLAILGVYTACVSGGGHNCDDSLCNNHGTCTINHNVQECACDDNWVMVDCSVDCSNDDFCNGNGKSHFHNGDCSCNCDNGFSGDRCQLSHGSPVQTSTEATTHVPANTHDNCHDNTFCNGNGKATFHNGNCLCTCNEPFYGPHCLKECTCSGHGHPHWHNGDCTCKNCDVGFHGVHCEIECTDQHTCHGKGQAVFDFDANTCSCTCHHGFTGHDCSHEPTTTVVTTQSTLPTVKPHIVCHGDFCNGNGIATVHNNACHCTCHGVFYGQRCEKECTCNGHGHVHFHDGVCTCHNCDAGYYGTLCELECSNKHTCSGNGNAVFDDDTKDCSCNCNNGFTGLDCSHECSDVVTCNGHGTATYFNSVHKCYCTCHSGYSGDHCEVAPLNPCLAKTCSGHGMCSLKADGHAHCTCYHGFKGHDCEACDATVLCNSQGTCDAGTGHCSCFAGYYGHDCGIECSDAGTCNGLGTATYFDSVHKCYCTCQPDYSGDHCEVAPMDPCLAKTCNGRGTCSLHAACDAALLCNSQGTCNASTGYCSCFVGFHGHDCSIDCTYAGFCNSNGAATYFDSIHKCYCTCHSGYSGDHCEVGYIGTHCEIPLSDPCLLQTCSGHGTCSVDAHGRAHCTCETGYSGHQCEACDSALNCNGNGVCNANTGNCTCHAGYHGNDCSIECSDVSFCNGQGTALYFESVQKCYCVSCLTGYSGPNCELSSNVCQQQTCSSHGICSVNARGGFHCTCDQGYHGLECNECSGEYFCSNHGNCTVVNGHHKCHCDLGFYSSDCHFECTDAENCLGHGTAHHWLSSHHRHHCLCTCDHGYTGSKCGQVIEVTTTTVTPTTISNPSTTTTTTMPTTATTTPVPSTSTAPTTTTTIQPSTAPTSPTTTIPVPQTCDQASVNQYMKNNISVAHTDAPACSGTRTHESTEALVMSYCSRAQPGTWTQSTKVMDDCSAVPLYSAVGTFVHGSYPTGHGLSGVFLGCTTDGFTMLVQGCDAPPTQLHIKRGGINLMDPNYYFIIQ